MYGKTSDNSQSRVDRHAQNGRSSDAGIDPSVFARHCDAEIERAKLIDDKAAVEVKLSQVKAQIRSAGTDRVGQDYKANCEAQRATLVAKLNGINKRLTAMNYAKGVRAAEAKAAADDFPKMFMQLAREMLAGPVYDRITVAAHHRQREQRDGGRTTPAPRDFL